MIHSRTAKKQQVHGRSILGNSYRMDHYASGRRGQEWPRECISYYYGHAVFQDVNWISSIRTCFGSRLVRSMPLQCPKRTLLHLLLPRKPLRLAPPFAVERQYRSYYDGSIKHGSASGANIKPTLLKWPSVLGLRWSSGSKISTVLRGTSRDSNGTTRADTIGKPGFLASRMSEVTTTTIGLVQTQRNVSFSIVQLRLPGIQLNRRSDRAAYPQFSERNPAVLESISSSVLKYVLNKINHLFHVAPAAMMVPHLEPGLAAVLEMAIALESSGCGSRRLYSTQVREGISKRIRDRIDIGVERTLSVLVDLMNGEGKVGHQKLGSLTRISISSQSGPVLFIVLIRWA